MIKKSKDLMIISLRGNPTLSSSLPYLDNQLIEISNFKDGEISLQLKKNISQKDILIIQSISKPVNENLMELLLTTSMLKNNGADKIHIFLTYMAYARQDKKVGKYKSLSGGDIFHFLEKLGINSIFTLDIHSEQILCAPSGIWVENLNSSRLLIDIFKNEKIINPVIVSPDLGGIKRCKVCIDILKKNFGKNISIAVLDKNREEVNKVKDMKLLIGEVEGKDCVIVDDMIDTGNTMLKAIGILKKLKAKRVFVYVTHGLFNGDFYKNFEKCKDIDCLYVSDSLPSPNIEIEKKLKIKRLSIKPLIDDFIKENF